MFSFEGMNHSYKERVMELVAYRHFIFHCFKFLLIEEGFFRTWIVLSHELNGIKLAVKHTASQVNFAEASDGQTVVYLVSEIVMCVGFVYQRIEKFCFQHKSFIQA